MACELDNYTIGDTFDISGSIQLCSTCNEENTVPFITEGRYMGHFEDKNGDLYAVILYFVPYFCLNCNHKFEGLSISCNGLAETLFASMRVSEDANVE